MEKSKKALNISDYGIQHIGIIMDGNGRWAKKRFMPRTFGHEKGSSVFKEITDYCAYNGLKYLTVYAFSTENWSRPKKEIDKIMNILREFFKELLNDKVKYKKKNVKIKFIGDITRLEDDILSDAKTVMEETKNMTGMTLNIAVNYGGRDEIITGIKNLYNDVENNKININDVTAEVFSTYTYTKNQPDPDMIIRTGGDFRTSNFLMWQSAYTEYMPTKTLWPDFKTKELDKMILDFSKRKRRFGNLDEEQ